ncbi:hypothetical protein [Paenibacillus tepidiphilus]
MKKCGECESEECYRIQTKRADENIPLALLLRPYVFIVYI